MPHAEGERIFTICNACRYCEGFCAVFPAMEKRLEFSKADLNYLANVCHNCQECFYACQYAPPHEFAVNVPKTLAQIRVASYKQFAWPGWLRPAASGLAWLCIAATLAGAWSAPRSNPGDFYGVIPHSKMVAFFATLALLMAIAFVMGARKFWKECGERGVDIATLKSALKDALTLRYLKSSGDGCSSNTRRMFHHATFYGFALCFASTTVAAAYHYLLNRTAPYAYTSLPVVLGTLGGLGLAVGTAGLGALRFKSDEQKWLGVEFLLLLFLTSFTGLWLLVLREGDLMAPLLQIHLGVVAALFLTMPYGKFVHGLYRALALLRYALESK